MRVREKELDAQRCRCPKEDRHMLGCPALAHAPAAEKCSCGKHCVEGIGCRWSERFAETKPVPAAPTDEWTTLGELKPGDVFETSHGRRGLACSSQGADPRRGAGVFVVDMGVMWAEAGARVRRLTVLNPGEIAVRVDENTVDAIASVIQSTDEDLSDKWAVRLARDILESLRAESKGGGGK